MVRVIAPTELFTCLMYTPCSGNAHGYRDGRVNGCRERTDTPILDGGVVERNDVIVEELLRVTNVFVQPIAIHECERNDDENEE